MLVLCIRIVNRQGKTLMNNNLCCCLCEEIFSAAMNFTFMETFYDVYLSLLPECTIPMSAIGLFGGVCSGPKMSEKTLIRDLTFFDCVNHLPVQCFLSPNIIKYHHTYSFFFIFLFRTYALVLSYRSNISVLQNYFSILYLYFISTI